MKNRMIAAAMLLACSTTFAADIPVPDTDTATAKDPAYLGRFTGSKLLAYTAIDFDAWVLPTGKLERVADPGDPSKRVVAPVKKLELEGKRAHYVYLLPEGTVPLAAIRNYQNAAKANGGKALFECKGVECGGSQHLSTGSVTHPSIGDFLWPKTRITDKRNSAAFCASSGGFLREQQFTAFEFPANKTYVAVMAFTFSASGSCKNFDARTFVMVETLETQAMAQTMETPSATEMVAAITTSGRVALYGILFDSGKTEVKTESKATMDEIAKLLGSNKSLKILVVGHTDNVGGYAPNLELSKKRAESVVAQLVSQYKVDPKRLQPVGVSFASPVAPNVDEAGRARNRRVELVAN